MKYLITESQYNKILTEEISMYLRRRLNYDDLKNKLDDILENELLPCEFDSSHDFITEACNLLAYVFLEDLSVSDRDSKGFYHSLVNLFGERLENIYQQECE
jgi:hypothetical protein